MIYKDGKGHEHARQEIPFIDFPPGEANVVRLLELCALGDQCSRVGIDRLTALNQLQPTGSRMKKQCDPAEPSFVDWRPYA